MSSTIMRPLSHGPKAFLIFYFIIMKRFKHSSVAYNNLWHTILINDFRELKRTATIS